MSQLSAQLQSASVSHQHVPPGAMKWPSQSPSQSKSMWWGTLRETVHSHQCFGIEGHGEVGRQKKDSIAPRSDGAHDVQPPTE